MGELGQTLTIVFCAISGASLGTNYILPQILGTADGSSSSSSSATSDKKNDDEGKGKASTQQSLPFTGKDIPKTEEMTFIEAEFNKTLYNAVFKDYQELSIQFGFIVLFVTAFPVAPFLAMILNFIECRVDGWKLLHVMRRPWPRACEDIGSWYDIFNLVSIIGVFFNAGIVCWTMDLFDNESSTYRMVIFFIFCFISFFLRYNSLSYFDLALEAQAEIQIKRQDHLCKKIIEKIPDDIDYDNANHFHYVQSPEYYIDNAIHARLSDNTKFFIHDADEN